MAWCAGDRVALSVMPNASVTGERPPIAGDIGSAISFHTGTWGGDTRGPTTAVLVGAIHDCPRRIFEPQCLAAVLQCAGIDLVGGDVGDSGVVGSLEQVEAVSGYRAGKGDVDVTFIHEGPSIKVDRVRLLVVEFDPLIVRRGQGTGPGDLVDQHRLRLAGRRRRRLGDRGGWCWCCGYCRGRRRCSR